MSTSDPGFIAALEEARLSASQGGVPIGACLVSSSGEIIGRGHNMRVQKESATLHVRPPFSSPFSFTFFSSTLSLLSLFTFIIPPQAEISALEASGRLPASRYEGATMYTTLSPCDMCTGACILYKIARVVIGENENFVGGEAYLKQRGVEVVVLQDRACTDMMGKFIRENPGLWLVDFLFSWGGWVGEVRDRSGMADFEYRHEDIGVE